MMHEDALKASTIREAKMRETAGHVITLYDSGVLKDRIAEMMDITRDKVDEIVDGRRD